MKKLLAVMLSVVLVLAMAVSSFAMVDGFEDDAEGEVSLGKSINDGNYGSDQQQYRSCYTANRSWATTDSGIIVEDNGGHVAKLTNSQIFTTDNGPVSGKIVMAFDLKVVSYDSFLGLVCDQTEAGAASDAAAANFPVNNFGSYADANDADLILNTGFGWTLLKTDSTKVRLFVSASNAGSPDYADFDLGFDAADGKYHHYAFYKDADESKAYFYADNKLIGSFDNATKIYDAEGTEKAYGNANLKNQGLATIAMIEAQDGELEVYIDNLEYNAYTDLPVEENPATGDASIVAFVAVAACVALVVLKKKETI